MWQNGEIASSVHGQSITAYTTGQADYDAKCKSVNTETSNDVMSSLGRRFPSQRVAQGTASSPED